MPKPPQKIPTRIGGVNNWSFPRIKNMPRDSKILASVKPYIEFLGQLIAEGKDTYTKSDLKRVLPNTNHSLISQIFTAPKNSLHLARLAEIKKPNDRQRKDGTKHSRDTYILTRDACGCFSFLKVYNYLFSPV